MISTRIRFALLTIALSLVGNTFAEQPVLPPPTPHAPSHEQALGFYAAGKLSNPVALPLQGDGFVKIFQLRKRFYGTTQLVRVIKTVARNLAVNYPEGERLQIGDIAGREGGELLGHSSHQNGLDVDIAYLRINRVEQEPRIQNRFIETFVADQTLSPNFDLARNWFVIKSLDDTGRLSRIFMDPVIKQAFCDYARTIGEFDTRSETLRKLRSYPNHDDHMHVRLKCPANSPRCIPQEEPPPGPGCEPHEFEEILESGEVE